MYRPRTNSPLLPIPSSGSYLLKLTSAFIFLLLLGLGSAELESVSVPDFTNYTGTSTKLSLNKFFEVPDHALRNVNFTYQSKQGGIYSASPRYELFNVTLTQDMFYNSSWLSLNHVAHMENNNGYTTVSYNNNTGTHLLYSTVVDSSLSLSCTLNAVSQTLAYDGSYTTGFFWASGNSRSIDDCTSTEKYTSTLYESTLYYDVGEDGYNNVLFLVLDEYGRVIEDAVITPKRITDNYTYNSLETDIVGKARFSLNDGYEYNITVSKNGYSNFSGVLNVYETSYTLTLQTESEGGIDFYGLDSNVSLIISPSLNPSPVLSNFSITATDTLSRLYALSVYAYLNGTLYNNTCYAEGYIPNITFSAPLNNYLYGEITFSADTGQNITTNNFNLNEAERNGGVSITTGKHSYGASFDGVNDYLNVSENYFNKEKNFTTAFYFKTDNNILNQTIFYAGNGVDNKTIVFLSEENIYCLYDNGIRKEYYTSIEQNTWYHFTMSYNTVSEKFVCYINNSIMTNIGTKSYSSGDGMYLGGFI